MIYGWLILLSALQNHGFESYELKFNVLSVNVGFTPTFDLCAFINDILSEARWLDVFPPTHLGKFSRTGLLVFSC